eukprot:m.48585 g.48585  ORF g.48585 m.48585 type:complete len:65 (+) comp8922_c0_seq1:5986-6180(+)
MNGSGPDGGHSAGFPGLEKLTMRMASTETPALSMVPTEVEDAITPLFQNLFPMREIPDSSCFTT